MTKHMGDRAIDVWSENCPVETVNGEQVQMIDIAAAERSSDGAITVSAVNKHDAETLELKLELSHDDAERKSVTVYTVNGDSKDAYNDIDNEQVGITSCEYAVMGGEITVALAPHSVNQIVIK